MAVATQPEYGLHIGGESVEPASGEVRELREPATGEPLARAAMGGPADTHRAVEAARAAVDGPWGKTPPTERSRLLHALADAIVANRKELAELEVRNVGKAISSVKAEVAQAIENFRFYGSVIASIAGRANPIGGSLLFYSLKEPVGVAGQIHAGTGVVAVGPNLGWRDVPFKALLQQRLQWRPGSSSRMGMPQRSRSRRGRWSRSSLLSPGVC